MGSPIQDSKMGVPEAVLEKVGSLPDIASMSKDDLSVLCKKLYDQGCSVLVPFDNDIAGVENFLIDVLSLDFCFSSCDIHLSAKILRLAPLDTGGLLHSGAEIFLPGTKNFGSSPEAFLGGVVCS